MSKKRKEKKLELIVTVRRVDTEPETAPASYYFERHKCPSCGWYGGSHKYNCPE